MCLPPITKVTTYSLVSNPSLLMSMSAANGFVPRSRRLKHVPSRLGLGSQEPVPSTWLAPVDTRARPALYNRGLESRPRPVPALRLPPPPRYPAITAGPPLLLALVPVTASSNRLLVLHASDARRLLLLGTLCLQLAGCLFLPIWLSVQLRLCMPIFGPLGLIQSMPLGCLSHGLDKVPHLPTSLSSYCALSYFLWTSML